MRSIERLLCPRAPSGLLVSAGPESCLTTLAFPFSVYPNPTGFFILPQTHQTPLLLGISVPRFFFYDIVDNLQLSYFLLCLFISYLVFPGRISIPKDQESLSFSLSDPSLSVMSGRGLAFNKYF